VSFLGVRRNTNERAPGFTLVELLVVIVIVAVLATVAIYGVRGALAKSKQAACASNLRSIGIGLHLYAGDHNGVFPETTHSTDLQTAWIYALEDHLNIFDKTRICPADPKAAQRLAGKGTSYILNSFLFLPPVDPFGEPTGPALNRLSAIPDHTNTPMAFICSDRYGPGPGNDHTHSEQWNSWSAVKADIAVGRFGGKASDDETGSTNILYVDGSIRGFRASELKRKTAAGINIAKPPGVAP